MIKIPKEIYKYIEYELYHYTDYKQELMLERERILESSPGPPDGMPRGSATSDSTQNKALKRTAGTAVLSLERRINAVDRTLNTLTDTHRQLFKKVYGDAREDVYRMCDELHVSRETFYRYKKHIVLRVGYELGLLNIA